MVKEEKKSHHIFSHTSKDESWAELIIVKILQRTSSKLTPSLAKTNVTPNQITFFRFLALIPIATYLFALGDHQSILGGLVVFAMFHFLDALEGSLARYKSMETELGGWLDWAFDMMGNNLITIGMTIGVITATGGAIILGIPAIKLPTIVILIAGLFALFSQQIVLYLNNELDRKFLFATNSRKIVQDLKKNRVSMSNRIFFKVLFPDDWIGQILFTVGWFIIIGALINQIAIMLVAIAFFQSIRILALFFLMVRALQKRESNLLIVNIMKKFNEAK
jgi:phosphatidylglycerophosphate synthase|tara:strand:+ start:384 stop:1217 length:834 start_codon:yes stop_codon:yes gene_type:complete